MQDDLLQILKYYWGYDGFRPGQLDIIQSILDGNDTLALMPTGGGKSLTFQVPALYKPGLCLVISPLVALMKDQVENLRRLGIMAVFISSEMSRHEILQQLDNCIYGNYKFLYISPERIASDLFQTKLRILAAKVNLLVVDEAHCISQWGNDFRPNYRLIADIRDAVPRIPVLAVTASATPAVTADICEQLHYRKGYRIFQSSFARKNLTFVVRRTEDKVAEMRRILTSVSGSAIVYCRTRKGTEEYAARLRSAGIPAECYHAGLATFLKAERQNAWLKGSIRVLVATNAFGMGINKGDVRVVIHPDFPDSLEAYYQEAGRAGRDGQRSYAVALVGARDIGEIKRRPSAAFPTMEYIVRVYDAIANRFQLAVGDGEGVSGYFDVNDFLHDFRFDKSRLFASLNILSLSGYLKFEPYPDTKPFLRYDRDRRELNPFLQGESLAVDVAIAVLRKCEGLFSEGAFIDVQLLANMTGHAPEVVSKVLSYLRNVGFYYVPAHKEPRVTFRTVRVPAERLQISKSSYDDRLEVFRLRIEKVLEYLTIPHCRQQYISAYFGVEEPPCGCCDNCIEANKARK